MSQAVEDTESTDTASELRAAARHFPSIGVTRIILVRALHMMCLCCAYAVPVLCICFTYAVPMLCLHRAYSRRRSCLP